MARWAWLVAVLVAGLEGRVPSATQRHHCCQPSRVPLRRHAPLTTATGTYPRLVPAGTFNDLKIYMKHCLFFHLHLTLLCGATTQRAEPYVSAALCSPALLPFFLPLRRASLCPLAPGLTLDLFLYTSRTQAWSACVGCPLVTVPHPHAHASLSLSGSPPGPRPYCTRIRRLRVDSRRDARC